MARAQYGTVTTFTELPDGREFICRYRYRFTRGYSDPDECDNGEPVYTLDLGPEMSRDELPPELRELADELYNAEGNTPTIQYRAEAD